ncbi:MAG: cytochrome c oxidase subunit 3, partial [Verrucomicrobiota bacterium]
MEIPYTVNPRRDTGLYNAKLGVWLFLASEVMLFGGLFSAYVFLRVGIEPGYDNPWPWGLNVHKGYVWLGFINTLVLIFSSVLVVLAWVALKERNWRLYQIYMYLVVGCALCFMGIKSVEYHSKLFKHHGIKMKDNSVMEGKVVDGTQRIRFEGQEVTFALERALPALLTDLPKDEFPVFTVKGTDKGVEAQEGETFTISSLSELKRFFHRGRREVTQELLEKRKAFRAAEAAGERARPVSVNSSVTLVADEPFQVNANRQRLVLHDDSALTYRDGSKVIGSLIDDSVKFELHEVDMQLVPLQLQRTAMVWDVINDEAAKEEFFTQQAEALHEMEAYYKGNPIPEKLLRGHYVNLHYVHIGGHHGDDHGDHADDDHHGENDHGDDTEPGSDHGKEHSEEASEHSPGPADQDHALRGSERPADLVAAKDDPHAEDGDHAEGDHGKGHGGHAYITVPNDMIKFMGNHGPRYGNYYAIYFTMTGLHGLHVVGGALVLLYFTIFGKKIYLKNPEHLANRVEVGGLFWHFVDLIWIFLFP